VSESALLCAECGAPADDVRAARCSRCGALRTVKVERALAEGPSVDAAWRDVARVTLAFLVANLALRVAVALASPRASHQIGAAAIVTGAVLGVYRALRRRNVTALAVWAWALSAGAAMSVVGAVPWWYLTRPPAWRGGLAAASVALAAASAWALRRCRRVIEG
jgi:hypothetical protein